MLGSIPFVLGGLWAARDLGNTLHWSAIAWFAGAVAAAWVGVGVFGLSGNAKMRHALAKRFATEGAPAPSNRWFVGIATPGYRSIWDPHEDIGFLDRTESALVFLGDSKRIEIPRSAIRSVVRGRNVHSYVLLGGWVAVNGILDGKQIRLLIEPRQSATLWGNRRLLGTLHEELQVWHRGAAKAK